jgi:hypothetical protein
MPQDQDQNQVLNPIEERILQFVKDNPGKSKSDVVRFLKDRHIAARIATLAHIDRLEGRKMIICQLENPNSQIYRIYINKDNQLSSIVIELEEFKEAYRILLEKSKEKINNKDYSTDAKALGLTHTDPTDWTNEEIARYRKFCLNRMIGDSEKHLELSKRQNELIQEIKKSESMEKKEYILQSIERLKSTNREQKSIFKATLDVLKSQSENLYILILGPVELFYVMADIIFFRSMIRWSSEISDKEMLSQMYSITYKKIAEIQLELSKFAQSIKIGHIHIDPVRVLIYGRYNRTSRRSLWLLADVYHEIDMDMEMRQVINSITKLNEDIKDLNLFYLNVDYHPFDELEELRRKSEKMIDELELKGRKLKKD